LVTKDWQSGVIVGSDWQSGVIVHKIARNAMQVGRTFYEVFIASSRGRVALDLF
jgi:hypothetical protein